MITEVPQLIPTTLYNAIMMTNGEGFDICDDVWDWGIYFGCPKSFEECESKDPDMEYDWYEALMLLFALNITCTKIQPKWYSVCLITQFIKDNIDVFRKFFNENNREGYRPMDYENAEDDTVDDGFYEAYMQPMESLIAGNYSYSDYEELYKALTNK